MLVVDQPIKKDHKITFFVILAAKGGAFFLNNAGGQLLRMVDACRYHALKTDILAVDACTSGRPIITFVQYGKKKASMKCVKCHATVNHHYIIDGVNFDLTGEDDSEQFATANQPLDFT